MVDVNSDSLLHMTSLSQAETFKSFDSCDLQEDESYIKNEQLLNNPDTQRKSMGNSYHHKSLNKIAMQSNRFSSYNHQISNGFNTGISKMKGQSHMG